MNDQNFDDAYKNYENYIRQYHESPESMPYDPNVWLYIPPDKAEHRYILGTRGQKPLICICENPSTAVPNRLDHTLTRISNYIENQTTYDSWIVLNLYPVRATNPTKLPKKMDNRLHQSNLAAIKFVLSQFDQPDIWLAWGGDIVNTNRQYLIDCVLGFINIANDRQPNYLCAIKPTKKGHPRHPSRLKDPIELVPFDMNKYREMISNISKNRARRATNRTTN